MDAPAALQLGPRYFPVHRTSCIYITRTPWTLSSRTSRIRHGIPRETTLHLQCDEKSLSLRCPLRAPPRCDLYLACHWIPPHLPTSHVTSRTFCTELFSTLEVRCISGFFQPGAK